MNRVLIWASLGLCGGLCLTAFCIIINALWLPTLVPHLWMIWLGFFIFMSTALLELPLMIYIIRHMAQSDKMETRRIAQWMVGLYVLFASIYAVPNLLLVDLSLIWPGLLIASTSFLRFGAALIFLRDLSTSTIK